VLIKRHNLTPAEYQRIIKVLGRGPTITEVGMFSVLWAEHCSYASSKIYLKTFPTKGTQVLLPAGKENAGLVDVGNGLAVAFKVESHNHPSAVEPHAGAATGVGGIVRDIFTMGARPMALLDSLRFGPLNGHGRTAFLFEGIVKGIADYGNAIGVPTVGGEIAFDACYRDNPLVNVMCIGLVPKGRIARARARGIGNPVLYVGSSTGRDGLGGASFASREITEGSDADRPAVQIGDPFAEKCLIEATLEALATGDVVGIQDMGAAGLTCSTCETADRGHCGMEIDVAHVPRREEGMTPYEVMLSESQERMLLIVKQGRQERLRRLFANWGLHAVEIGHVTDDGLLRVKDRGTVVAEIPVKALTSQAPVYRRAVQRPRYLARVQRLALRRIPPPTSYVDVLLTLLRCPTIANKAFVYEQYDHMVQTNTVVLPGRADAAVLRLKGTPRSLAATTDGNGRYCYLDPYEGGKLAVAEAARNLVCVGARPLAVTDGLNFGNPEDPEIMWQFKECVRGIAEACRAFRTPVTGGNVSFYNESPRGAIDPTPVIGMIGLIERLVTANFKDEGDAIVLLGETKEELGGSEYLNVIHQRKQGKPPRVNLLVERRLHRLLLQSIRRGLIKSAHDCSEGGLAVALAECCIMDPDHLIGAVLYLAPLADGDLHQGRGGRFPRHALRPDALLFGESAGRVVVTCAPSHVVGLQRLAHRRGIAVRVIGQVGGRRLSIAPWIEASLQAMDEAWRTGLSIPQPSKRRQTS
jgi:phosphoribosylformylglycinamidine synthase